MGPVERHDRRRPPQTPNSRRNHIVNRSLQLGNCSVITVGESILGGTTQNPLAFLEEARALASAIYVSRPDTSLILTRN